MVCDRCKTVLEHDLRNAGINILSLELGEVEVQDEIAVTKDVLKEIAERNGFEIIDSNTSILVEKVKSILIKMVAGLQKVEGKTSTVLSEELKTDYSMISKLFSACTGITIEKYLIKLKIEKAKELLQMDSLTFSEIAYSLDYSSGSYLSKQFKNETGMSMTEYKKLQKWDRITLDKIV